MIVRIPPHIVIFGLTLAIGISLPRIMSQGWNTSSPPEAGQQNAYISPQNNISSTPISWAQDALAPTNIPIEFLGTVETLSPDLIVVDQLPVTVTGAAINVPLQPGHFVRVRGVLQPDGSILAQAVDVANTNGLTPTPLPQVTPLPTSVGGATAPDSLPIIVIEGLVEAVNEDGLMVNGLNFNLDPSNPVLAAVRPDDFVRIEGLLQESGFSLIFIPTDVRIDRNTPVPNAQPGHPPPARAEGMGMGDNSSGSGMGMGMGD